MKMEIQVKIKNIINKFKRKKRIMIIFSSLDLAVAAKV